MVLGSGIALLDGTVVNVAARTIGEDLDAGLPEVQWILNGYLLSLSALILIGSSLGDRHGRRRMFLLGVGAFGIASVLCAFARTPEELIVFRVLQGVAAALVTPGALALIQTSFRAEDRPAAIGTWAGYTGIAAALGPFLGGFLVENIGWRWIFAINVPLCLAVLWFGRAVPESCDEERDADFDLFGALAGAVGLGLLTVALTSWRSLDAQVLVLVSLAAIGSLVAFGFLERRPGAMAPLELFGSRTFAVANLMTFLVYGALGVVLFLVILQLQVTSGYTPLEAGVSTLPLTLCMLVFSARAATVAARIGPRVPMSLGPLICAFGVALLAFVGEEASYVVHVLPGMLLFAVGMTLLVSPLTTAVLAAVPDRRAGVASGINNTIARAGSLLAVAALPAVVGLSGADYQDPGRLTDGFRTALLLCALLLVAAAAASWRGLRPTDDLAAADQDQDADVDPGYPEQDAEYDDQDWEYVDDEEWAFDDTEPAPPDRVDP